MPMPMTRPEPLKGASHPEGVAARLLDDDDVDLLTAEEEEDEEEGQAT